MRHSTTALLRDRGVVRVAGEDAEKLLQGIVTNDLDLLGRQPAVHAGLLSPQGKLLFEFFVVAAGDGFLLETGEDQVAGLIKRLTMYKLRAKVEISDASAAHGVLAVWGAETQSPGGPPPGISFLDPRMPELGRRVLADAEAARAAELDADAQRYHAHRIALGVPESGKDYALGEIFPHEANFDLLNGVSFSKGCFVGQEVVSRMQHRGTARKRIVIVEADQTLPSGSEITAGDAVIGSIGSVAGSRSLALVRLDRADEARHKGQTLTAAGAEITIRLPDYMPQSATVHAR